jgi:hypothetical protein
MTYRVLEVSYTADGPEPCWRTGDIADEQTARDRAQTLLLRTKLNDDTDFVVMELPIAWLSDLAKKGYRAPENLVHWKPSSREESFRPLEDELGPK